MKRIIGLLTLLVAIGCHAQATWNTATTGVTTIGGTKTDGRKPGLYVRWVDGEPIVHAVPDAQSIIPSPVGMVCTGNQVEVTNIEFYATDHLFCIDNKIVIDQATGEREIAEGTNKEAVRVTLLLAASTRVLSDKELNSLWEQRLTILTPVAIPVFGTPFYSNFYGHTSTFFQTLSSSNTSQEVYDLFAQQFRLRLIAENPVRDLPPLPDRGALTLLPASPASRIVQR
jgi:hypothetical protein